MAPLTHVLFDFFGTLVTYSDSWTEQGYPRSHEFVRARGGEHGYEELLEELTRTFAEFETRAQQTLDEYSMDAVCARLLSRVLASAPDEETVSAFRDTYTSEWNKGVTYIPGVREMLTSLAERFTLVLVSNTHYAEVVHGHLRELQIGDCFRTVITSIEHGKRKPSPCIFERALAETSGRPERAAYVGDSFAADYRGATGAGLRCLLIDPARRYDIVEQNRVMTVLEAAARLSDGEH